MGRVDLGLTQPEFWRLTFHLFLRLYERFAEIQKREDYRAGVICATLANIHRNKRSRKKFEPGDFFKTLEVEKKEMTWEDQLSYIRKLNAMLGGRAVTK